MTKFFKRVFIIMLTMLCMTAFAACGNKGKKPSGPSTPNGLDDPDTPIIPDTPTEPDIPDNPHKPQPEVEVATVVVGDVRVQLLSSTLVRVEQKGAKGFEDRASYYVPNRNKWQVVEYTKTVGDDETLVVTDGYTVHIPSDGTAEEVYITGKNGAPLYSYVGDVGTNVYLPSPSDELNSWYFTDSPRIIPSESGYSVSESNEPLQGWDLDNKATDIFVFLPNGSYSTFCKDYVNLTGPSEMVTLNTLGYWDSRWYADSAESALKRITDYVDRGYSIDVVVVDVDYKDAIKNGQWGVGYEINKTLFPDMAGFLKKCHELGVSVVFNDHPIPVPGTDNLLDKSEVEYRENSLTCFLALGVDYWWYDRNWDACLNPIDPDISVYATGMYAFQFITQKYYESITDIDEYARRALIMGNVDGLVNGKWMYASDVSAHRYTIQWTGDIGTGSNELAAEIYNAVFGGAENGLPYMSSDMGGFKTSVSDEQYIRWYQYCALSSVIRAHVDTTAAGQVGRMPWLYGELAEEVAHTYEDMRYRLLPLYYELAYRNYSEGLPVLARTDIVYPQYAEASANDQYLLGDYILIAPIAEAELKRVDSENLTHTDGGTELPGLLCEYYTTANPVGTPAYTGVADNIYFDWGLGAPAGLPADNFSLRFTGNIRFDKKAALKFYADDDVLVYIDNTLVVDGSASNVYDKFLSTPEYEAGSTHSIVVRYGERGANAHIYMYLDESVPASEITNSRDVFIPDGTWIDVWTGERFVGPKTYTVTHTLKTSPIFVREGAIVPLAKNAVNTSSVLWNEMTLDVYPSKNFAAKAVVYEDDVTTVAYKDGQYRTTDISMTGGGDVTKLNIAAAVGVFDGERAFTKRTWNIRLHKNPGWGEVVSVKVDGKACEFELVAKSGSAKPFAFSGAAADGDVYEFSFDAWVYAGAEIEIEWGKTENSDINADYDSAELTFEVTHSGAGDSVTLDTNTEDWVSYGVANERPTRLVSYPTSYDAAWNIGGVFFCSEYTEGGKQAFDFSAKASNMNFDWTVKTLGKPAYYVFYVGGEYCTADFTVRDRAGNVKTVTFGNMNGAFTRRVAIFVDDETESELYVKYSVNSGIPVGTGTKSTVTAIAALVSEQLPDVVEQGDLVTVGESEINEPTDRVDLTVVAGETGDWMRFEQRGHIRKQGGGTILGASFTEESVLTDYPSSIVYSDGETAMVDSAVHSGRFAILGDITLTLSVNPTDKYIVLYAGAWNATCSAEIYTAGGKLLGSSGSFAWQGGGALCKTIIMNIDVKQSGIIIVKLKCSDANVQTRGNISLAAAVVTPALPEPQLPTTQLDCNVTAYTQTENVDLTALGTKDWAHFHSGDVKQGGGSYIDKQSLYCDQDLKLGDYRLALGWTDGTIKQSESGNRGGIFANNISIRIKVDSSVTKIRLWTGGWESDLNVKASTDDGTKLIDRDFAQRQAGYSNASLIEFDVTAEAEEYITFTLTNKTSGGGNVVLIAAAVA